MKKFTQNFLNDVKIMMEQGCIPMLIGEPGIGKSSWVLGLGDLWHTKVFVLGCNELAVKEDLTGARLVPNPVKTDSYMQVFYPHVTVAEAIDYAEANPRETPVLFLDELNRTTADVTSALLGIATTRRIGNRKLPDNLRIIIAGNDKGNVTALDTASISRFVKCDMAPDAMTFINLMGDKLNPFVKNVLSAHPETIFCKFVQTAAVSGQNDDDDDNQMDLAIEDIIDDADDMRQFTTPRTIDNLSRWLNQYSNQELLQKLTEQTVTSDGEPISDLEDTIRGFVGQTAFTTFLMQEISQNAMNVNNQAGQTVVGKPNCYDDLKKCSDMTTLNAYIGTMTDNDKSGCLLYALYEKEDNKVYINALAAVTPKLERGDIKTLMELASNDNLDEENVSTLINTGSPIAGTLSVILTC